MNNSLFLVYPNKAESGTLETLPTTKDLQLIKEDNFLKTFTQIPESSKVCITSEAILDHVLSRITNQDKVNAIRSMKDKFLFRELIKEIYPDMGYSNVAFDDISSLNITSKKVIKPIKGCFGTAVKIIDRDTDLDSVKTEIKAEIQKNSAVLSEHVLSVSEFILEDFIEGEEYAVDMFYDSKGSPHIVNIYYHPIPKHVEYLHMIYYTNKNVFEKVYVKAMQFFKTLNAKLKLTNTALHSEFKLDEKLIPIEINAMRFGGMGLGNMVYHSLGVNPYQHFIEEKSPDWDSIWKDHSDTTFTFFIAYNGTNVDKTQQQPNLEKLEQMFSQILNKTIFDYQKQLAFGIYTLKEQTENIDTLLQIDFNNYFKPIT